MRTFPVILAALLLAVAVLGSPALAAAKKKKKVKKGPDYDNNPYKAVVEKEPSHYRFNSKGEPVDGAAKPKNKSRNQSRGSLDGATKVNLGAMRTALSIYYGDLEGEYPADLDQLTKDAKYLVDIPSADTGHHPKSNTVTFTCGASQLEDTGGWAYCNEKTHKEFGTVLVDCTHQDSKGKEWHSY